MCYQNSQEAIKIDTSIFSQKPHIVQLFDWLNAEKTAAFKTAVENWPDDYRFFVDTALWFEQITEAVKHHPPTYYVKHIIIEESMNGTVKGVSYDYYESNDSANDGIAFRITTVLE